MQRNTIVSYIMTTYNHEKYIYEAVNSVLNQTISDIELIIVDDGSTDKTGQIISAIHDERIKYFYQKNQGPSVAINRAITEASGKYLAIMAGDDISYPERTEIQLKTYEKGATRILFSHCDFINEKSNFIKNHSNKLFNHPNRKKHEMLRYFFFNQNYLNAITVFTEKEIFNTIGFFDPRLLQLQDFDMWVRALVKNYDIEIIPQKLIKYRIRDKKQNLSSQSVSSLIRDQLEWSWICKNYIEIRDIDYFAKIFPEIKKENSIIHDDLVHFYLALIAIKSDSYVLNTFGINLIHDIQHDEKIQKKLDDYGLMNFKDFSKLTGSCRSTKAHFYFQGFNKIMNSLKLNKYPKLNTIIEAILNKVV